MNEFDTSQQLSDFQILSEIAPSWMDEKVEPFIPQVESSVVPPTWNKIQMDLNNTTTNSTNNAQQGTVRFVAGVEVGSGFVPMIVTASGGSELI